MATFDPTTYTYADGARQFLDYQPTLGGNAVFLALFAILIPIALWLGFRYSSVGFGTAIATGLALEVVGYIGRLLLHSSPNNRSAFIVFLVGTILGPTCICAAIFLTMPRIVAVYGEEYRSWRPNWYLYLFAALFGISFVLELAGSLVSTIHDDNDQIDTGIQVAVAGLAIQLATLIIFIVHGVCFAIALRTRQHGLDPKFAAIYNSKLYSITIALFVISIIAIIIRTAYRLVDVAEGYASSIAQNEELFLVLDGFLMLLAIILLLIGFPARALGQAWVQTSPRRLSQKPPRPIRPAPPSLLPSARPSPTFNRMSMKSSVSNSSPRKASYPPPPPPPPAQRGMVDSDALW
ncbi:hypothetical protein F5Y18DRAFT_414370 [Xylariaceae sp. FL1019]|nr:hypothetical protein F5Y18DRAFT_414370 [Xylariaceae sp. FL1019]